MNYAEMLDNKKQFNPECLTVSLGAACNLRCCYCYAQLKKQGNDETPDIDFIKSIKSAARLVAENCKAKNIPFYFGFQGNGEPLLYFTLLKQVYSCISKVAEKYLLNTFSFITSNGTAELEKYSWIAAHFNRICISVDGTPEIHNYHRQFKEGGNTFAVVKKTIKLLRRQGSNPVCRLTVTKNNVKELPGIIEYFIKDLGFNLIQTEPVYAFNKKNLYPGAEDFVSNFLMAKKIAQSFKAKMFYSGLRLEEYHSTYCNIQKNVLFINPKGMAMACLFNENEAENSVYSIGHYCKSKDIFLINYNKLNKLYERVNTLPEECLDCEVRGHCVIGCPDFCLIERNRDFPVKQSIRCRINRLLIKNLD